MCHSDERTVGKDTQAAIDILDEINQDEGKGEDIYVGVLGDRLESSLNNLSKNIVTKAMGVQKYETLFEELSKFDGLTENEVMVPSSKFTIDVRCMLVFFSVPAHQRISQ
ncbi:hypothetical protein J1N35_042334 [Gossypium stocksii]|uniref:Uncharacterized protein n=1 Tax=Gossypium stocksii TaxID=47602 RepID=A0A9D3UHC6_9ROSI|nr:hypothetical protein J1N35_042334 [Gossypium stocksii]